MRKKFSLGRSAKLLAGAACLLGSSFLLLSSSHREAPLISNDPLADNTDLYAFRSPTNPNKVVIIANYIPGQLPQGGPNYYSFGEDVRYEIHIDNDVTTDGDDIVYRFTFDKKNEDPTTFFNIRLGKQNLKTTYTLEKFERREGWRTIIRNGIVPPPNIGPRSISSPVGLNAPHYNSLITSSIKTANSGEKVFCGTADDPFYVDLGGIFDLGDAPRTTGSKSRDGLKCLNVSTIAMEIDIASLQKDHKAVNRAANILDPNYVIGVWASASRQKITVLNDSKNGRGDHYNRYDHDNDKDDWKGISHSGPWVQVSRLGMPLTNEAVVPIGQKDLWNSMTPYEDLDNINTFGKYFYQPELALYMDDTFFGGAVPAFAPLRIQRKSLGAFGFGNDQQGLYPLKNTPAVAGTALAKNAFGDLLLKKNSPRSVDLWPIFHTGVPNLRPYQLATGKAGNPLASGKPFINNFLPNGGDMLRLNMAVPATPRNDANFSSLGLVQAAVLGLTNPTYNANASLQFIPNMDGFPNGRRLEDDVTLIELQAVSGVVLAAIGLWYDDFDGANPVSQDLLDVLTYKTGINRNDTSFKTSFPFVQTPWPGTNNCDCDDDMQAAARNDNATPQMNRIIPQSSELGVATPEVFLSTTPNPSTSANTVRYRVETPSQIKIVVMDGQGRQIRELVNKKQEAGIYSVNWNTAGLSSGAYFITVIKDGNKNQTLKLIKE
ncbi:MAG: DUF4331 family protein [Chitinophagaceae bacterium]